MYLRYLIRPWHSADGQIGGIIIFNEDITERVTHELELERSNHLLEQTQALSGVGGWSLDLRTSELHWTDQTFAIHGLDRSQGEPDVTRAIEMNVPEHRAMVREALERTITRHQAFDFEAEIVCILGDTPRGTTAAGAAPYIKLVTLCNDVTLRNLIPAELKKGFGFFQGKPATAFAPFAVTPDELGDVWRDGRLHAQLRTTLNGGLAGDPHAGPEMHFSFHDLIQHIAKTRAFTAGTLLGSGTVSTAAKPFARPMDPNWRSFTARMIAKSEAQVVPIFFEGQNSRLFQMASRMHATLRTGLFIKEFKKGIKKPVRMVVGEPIPRPEINAYRADARAMMDFLRERTYALSPEPLDATQIGFEFEGKAGNGPRMRDWY